MDGSWIAIDSTSDRRERARSLAAVRESVLAGGSAPASLVRNMIVDSWQRSRLAGVDAECGLAPVVVDEGEAHARWQDHPLAAALPSVRELLRDTGNAAHQVLLFCDADGTLLWIEGEPGLVSHARDVRLEPGTVWSEAAAGTNAMGTALVTGHPVQVFSAEHYARPVHGWTCSAAPIHDLETGLPVGVLDLSGSLETAHPHSLAVVSAAARIVEQELRRVSEEAAARLLSAYGDRIGTDSSRPGALLSAGGRVLAAAREDLVGHRLVVPSDGGSIALPGGDAAIAEPLGDGRGFLVWPSRQRRAPERSHERSASESPTPSRRQLGVLPSLVTLGRDSALLTGVGSRTLALSPRHSELVMLMALRPGGWTAEQLAQELLGDRGKPVSIRAELSRLRRLLGPLLASRPYHLRVPVRSDFVVVEECLARGDLSGALAGLRAGELLPSSIAPTITEARFRLTMSVREAVIAAREPDLLRDWLRTPPGDDDIQACRQLIALCPPADPRHALAAGRLRRLATAH